MNVRLSVFDRVLSRFAKRRMLEGLATVTAQGFGTRNPEWRGRDFDSRLREYAWFTAHEAGLLIVSGDRMATEAIKNRLCIRATQLGRRLREALGVRGTDEAFRALRVLYRQIGIELDGDPSTTITVGSCFFAQYYSDGVCRVIESLDQGVVKGLFDGVSLEFTERITEGRPCCRAVLGTVSALGRSGT